VRTVPITNLTLYDRGVSLGLLTWLATATSSGFQGLLALAWPGWLADKSGGFSRRT
jgi:hypothetical protein